MRDNGGLERIVWSHEPEQQLEPTTLDELPTATPASEALALDLRAHGFAFVGPTTAWALMEAAGLVDAHLVGCHRRGAGRRSA